MEASRISETPGGLGKFIRGLSRRDRDLQAVPEELDSVDLPEGDADRLQERQVSKALSGLLDRQLEQAREMARRDGYETDEADLFWRQPGSDQVSTRRISGHSGKVESIGPEIMATGEMKHNYVTDTKAFRIALGSEGPLFLRFGNGNFQKQEGEADFSELIDLLSFVGEADVYPFRAQDADQNDE